MRVSEIMNKNVVSCQPDDDVATVARLLRDSDVGLAVVLRGRETVGVVTDRDLVVRVLAAGADGTTKVREAMSTVPLFCDAGQDLDDAVGMMRSRGIRRALVRDTKGNLVGILSMTDILDLPTRTAICRVLFYKHKTGSTGGEHRVPLSTVFVPGTQDEEEAVRFAQRKFEADNNVSSWNELADGYEVVKGEAPD